VKYCHRYRKALDHTFPLYAGQFLLVRNKLHNCTISDTTVFIIEKLFNSFTYHASEVLQFGGPS